MPKLYIWNWKVLWGGSAADFTCVTNLWLELELWLHLHVLCFLNSRALKSKPETPQRSVGLPTSVLTLINVSRVGMQGLRAGELNLAFPQHSSRPPWCHQHQTAALSTCLRCLSCSGMRSLTSLSVAPGTVVLPSSNHPAGTRLALDICLCLSC